MTICRFFANLAFAPWMPAPLLVADTNPLRCVQVVSGWQPTPDSEVAWLRTVRDTSPAEHRPAAATHDRDWPAADARQRCGLGPPPVQLPNTDPSGRCSQRVGCATCADGRAAWLRVPKAPNADPLRPLVVCRRNRYPLQRWPGCARARDANFGAVAAVPQPYLSRRAAAAATIPAVGRLLQRSSRYRERTTMILSATRNR